MRTPIIAGNWKMNTNIDEAVALVKEMRLALHQVDGVEKVVCPPFVSLSAVKAVIAGSSIILGAQNMHFEEKGAFTGEISPLMLAGLCQIVILGHSERRQYFHENNEIINKKMLAALKVNLQPILCVGEKLEERESGKTEPLLDEQLKAGLAGVSSIDKLTIAYEPIWAIGTGRAATGKLANETIGFIRKTVAHLFGQAAAQDLRILYGGSVTAENIGEFMKESEIDGALVGGASLKATQFVSIVKQSADIRK
ncbi:MAG: triose-phosphate isomerase [Chloroflexi bacterium]|nr:triose-phosphate isomerase [Chloroflexota bacterium]